ncbi:GIY-YIG nuclease family protein [Salinarimonas soli]|uniref:GIY-YIG nuclease family protein n=1 Tax=Salinarimonas soli TaxID=1638099 RepID=A0A5B2VHN7_9HYPH|nr:GIY-YIG nuclease family protein [Salinarimonas soli]KAA2237697.1 GIY-YIG nuclease family protein [Salinarimonas soli]
MDQPGAQRDPKLGLEGVTVSGSLKRVELAELPKAASRYVYVVAEQAHPMPLKIGVARHPLWRLHDLQSGNPRRLELLAAWEVGTDRAFAIERHVKEQLAGRKVLGEWFMAGLSEVEALIEGSGI